MTFDWVTARAKCSAAHMFEKLKMAVSDDVKVRNELVPKDPEFGAAYGFSVAESHNAIRVVRESQRGSKTIAFSLEGEEIKVADANGALVFFATVSLNDEGVCVFKVDKEERELWQVCRRALEDIFFPV
jgi:hypothetical protein